MKTEVFKKESIILIFTILLFLLIVYAANNLPVIGSVVLNSTAPTSNNTLQNLTCWNISVTDADGEPIKTIFNWYKDGEMLEFLNVPFEGNTTKGKDYSDYNVYCSEGGVIHFETFDGGITDHSGLPWTARDGNWSTAVVEPNIKKFGAYSGNTTDTDGGNGSIYVTAEYNPKAPVNAIDNTSEAYFDLWYKCELGARWGIMVSNDSWNCIKGSGNITCGDNYNPIGNFTPEVICDDTWRHTEYNISKYFPGITIKEVILGDWDRINTSNQNKVMWFDNFQIYNTLRVPVWNPIGGYDGFGAYSFDGIDDYINCGRNKLGKPTNNITLTAWIKTSARYGGIFGSYTTYPTKLGYRLCVIDGNISMSGDLQDMSGPLINDSKWHFVAGTYIRVGLASEAKLYVDGILVNSDTVVGTEPYGWVAIGTDYGPGGGYTIAPLNFFNGTIDDVRLYNRTLSAEQIRLLYENKSWIIHSEETKKGEDWKCSVTPIDGTEAGTEVNSSTVTILNSIPTVSLRLPLNNTNSTTQLTQFIYNVTDADGNEIENCTFWIENSTGLIKIETNTSITIDQNISISLNLDYEEINWLVSCEDSSSSKTNSSTWIYTVIQPPAGPTGGPSHSSRSYYLPQPEEEPEEKEQEISKEEKQDQIIPKERLKLPEKENKLKKYVPIILASSLISLFIIFNWKAIIKILLKK